MFVSSVYSLNAIYLKCASNYLGQQCEFYLDIFIFLPFYGTIFEVRPCNIIFFFFCGKICPFIVSTIYLRLLMFRRRGCKKCTPYCKGTLLASVQCCLLGRPYLFPKSCFFMHCLEIS